MLKRVFLFALIGTAAYAQGVGGEFRRTGTVGGIVAAPQLMPAIMPWSPNLDELKQALGLTDSQVQQFKQLQQTRAQESQAIYQQIVDKQRQLTELLNSGSMDVNAIGQLEIDIAGLRKQTTNNTSNKDQALAVLTADQKVKLAGLENALALQRAVNEAVQVGLLSNPQPAPGHPMPMMFSPNPVPR